MLITGYISAEPVVRDKYMNLERTHSRCLDIRNRVYPEHQWPGVIHRQAVIEEGGEGKTLLEVGCGRAAKALHEYRKHYTRVCGVDLEIPEEVLHDGNMTLYRGDAHELPIDSDSVDVVVTGDVLEHLEYPLKAFQEIARVLQSGGCAILTTVNVYFPPIVMSRLLPHRLRQVVNRASTGTRHEDTFPAYYRANSASSLNRMAQQSGLQQATFDYLSHHPRYFMFSVTAYRIAIVFEKIIRRSAALKYIRHYLHAKYVKP